MECAIVGVGQTAYVRGAGKSTMGLALEACKNALLDAALVPADIDGVILFWLDEPISTHPLALSLGIPQVDWQLTIAGGGFNGPGIITTASAAIQAGLCRSVLCLHAANRFSARAERFANDNRGSNLTAPFGLSAPPQNFALWAQRHMFEYGTTVEQLGEIAVTCRQHASLNPRALMQEPFTIEEYLDSRMITSPFRLLDCCLETDGAAACIVTSLERARDLPHPPVQILGGVCNASGPAAHDGRTGSEYTSMGSRFLAQKLWAQSGVGPSEMDFAQLYDCFTFTVLSQLEDLGYCAKGEGGPFVEGGRLRLGGELPTNTSGGHLSEGYVRSMNLVNEGVRQLRHEFAGSARQVPNAKLGVVTGAPVPGSAIVIARVD